MKITPSILAIALTTTTFAHEISVRWDPNPNFIDVTYRLTLAVTGSTAENNRLVKPIITADCGTNTSARIVNAPMGILYIQVSALTPFGQETYAAPLVYTNILHIVTVTPDENQ